MERKIIPAYGKWAVANGSSFAVRVGNIVEISGLIASDEEGMLVGDLSAYDQTKFVLKKMEKVLKEAGATFEDVVRTRLFVTDINLWKDYAKAHKEVFGKINPASTIIEVKRLIMPEYLISIDATAIIR